MCACTDVCMRLRMHACACIRLHMRRIQAGNFCIQSKRPPLQPSRGWASQSVEHLRSRAKPPPSRMSAQAGLAERGVSRGEERATEEQTWEFQRTMRGVHRDTERSQRQITTSGMETGTETETAAQTETATGTETVSIMRRQSYSCASHRCKFVTPIIQRNSAMPGTSARRKFAHISILL